MFYTMFYNGEEAEFSIIHENEAAQYGEDLATYKPYVEVKQKPTLEEAKTIFKIIKGATLCAGIESAKTEKLT